MEKDQTRIYAVIATSGRPDSLETTLQELVQVDLPQNFERLIVVENGPRAGAKEILARYGRLPSLYLYEPQANKSIALNCALAAVAGDPLLVFFDDDVSVDKRCLSAYAQAAQLLPAPCYLGGPTRALYEQTPPEWLLLALPVSYRGLGYPEHLGLTTETIMFLGFNWACRRELLLRAGSFDPLYGPGSKTHATGQENEMQKRLRALGVKGYYVPGAIVTHRVRQDALRLGWTLRRDFRHGVEHGLAADPWRFLGRGGLRLMLYLCKKEAFHLLRRLFFHAGRLRGIFWRVWQPDRRS